MTKTLQNYALDWASFLLLASLAATGMLMAYAMPPGNGGASVLGLARHDWGEIHLWIAWGFIAAVVVHLVMHGAWIKAMTLGSRPGRARVVRGAAAIGAALVLAAVVAVAAFAPATPGAERGTGARHGRGAMVNSGGEETSPDEPAATRGPGRHRVAE